MATRDGKEVPQCERCTQTKDDVRERTITKPVERLGQEPTTVEQKRQLCDDCAANVAGVYEVSPLGRTPARAKQEGDNGPLPAGTPPRGVKKED